MISGRTRRRGLTMGETERQLGAVLTILRMFGVVTGTALGAAAWGVVYWLYVGRTEDFWRTDDDYVNGIVVGGLAALAVALPIALVALLAGRKKGG
jgi:hypothetical protein